MAETPFANTLQACRQGQLDIVKSCIEENAVLNLEDHQRALRLWYKEETVSETKEIKTIKTLIQAACESRSEAIVSYLLSFGRKRGGDVVAEAIELGSPDALRLLIDRHPDIPNRRRWLCSHYARPYLEVAANCPSYKAKPAMQILLEAGADPDLVAPGLMFQLVRKGDSDLVEMVRKRSKKQDPRDYLRDAVRVTSVPMVEHLAKIGADVNHSSDRDGSVLAYATAIGDATMVQCLISLGAK